jgi:hypothetical protein
MKAIQFFIANRWFDSVIQEFKGDMMSSMVSRPPAADALRALKHFQSLLEFETDCWNVHHAIANNRKDFVLLDGPPSLRRLT